MSKNTTIIVIIVVAVIILGWFLFRPKTSVETVSSPQPAATSTSSESATPSSASGGASMNQEKNLVTISSSGFSPQSITVKVGEPLTFENTDTENHTVNSDNHPTHLLYPFLNLGLIQPGEKKSVTLSKIGTFTYHDHLNPSLKGSVTVQ